MDDDHPCNVEEIGIVCIKMDDRIVRELKEVRYVSQIKRNLISVGALKMLGLVVALQDDVLMMTKGSIVVMKGVRRSNLYYLKGSTVIGPVETFISSDNICSQVWQMKVGHEVKGLCKL